MSVIFDQLPVYGILGDGRLIQTSTFQEDGNAKFYVGGKIFYIDSTATGATYTFYSKTGKILTDVRVGDEPYAYSVTGTPSKDKYYVFNANAVTSKVWTYKDGSGNWVYTALRTTDTIGSGKTNTSLVLAADEGAYGNYNGNIWYSLKGLNTSVDKGCSDWFVPSKSELEALRTATDRDGNALTTLFSNTHIWSSFELSATHAWYWLYSGQYWDHNLKLGSAALVAARGF